PYLAHSVGDALLDREREHARREALEHRRIEVTTARRDRVPGGGDPPPWNPAGVDRLHERDVEEQSARLYEQPEVAHRGEAAEERPAARGYRAHEQHGGVVLARALNRGTPPSPQ